MRPRIPRIILHKAHLAPLDTPRARGKRVGPNMRLRPINSINHRTRPRRPRRILDAKNIAMRIRRRDLDGAGNARTAVRAVRAICVCACRACNETREDGVDYGVGAVIFAGLEACVADIALACEAELLRVVVAGFVGCVWHCDWETYVF